jgi:ligand-binding sensor domain-containing protein
MSSALFVVVTAALAATLTNTETVHDLESFSGHVVACTEGGLELFTPAGESVRVLTVEEGLPSHFCRALELAGDRLFVATDEGLVSLDARLRVERVLDVRWHALPPAEGASPGEYVARLGQLAAALPEGPTYTALSTRFAGTADGRVLEPGTEHLWPVPGPVRYLAEERGGLKVGTSEGAFFIDAGGKLTSAGDVPVGPLAYARGAGGGVSILGSQGDLRTWEARTREDTAGAMPALPLGATALSLSPEGATWVGTRQSGVHLLARGAWRRVTPTGQLCGNHVTALTRHRGRLVVGTFDRGVCWQRGDGRWQTFRTPALPSNQVLGVASDGTHLYVATTYGLGLYDGKTWTQLAFGGRNPVALGKLSVLAAVRRDAGLTLVDGRGASVVAPGGQTLSLVERLLLPEGWSEHPSVADGAGRFLWVASEDRGLVRWDGARWQRFHDGRDLTDNWVTALSTDAEGRAVAGTCQEGFSYFDGSRWTRVREARGLPSRAIVSTALVPEGALIGTLLGAAHYDAGNGHVRSLPRLADPRVYAVLVEGDSALFGTEGGLSSLDWKKALERG